MTLIAPLWLLGLIPWAVLTWWLLTRRAHSAAVPYVDLWRTNETLPNRAAARLRRPPLPLLLALISLLLAVLAAARPATTVGAADAPVEPVAAPATRPVDNVGITFVSARATPRPATMVRVRNQSTRTSAELRVESGGEVTSRSIELPASGQERDYFVDLPRMGDTVSLELKMNQADDVPTDDRASLARRRAWPKIEPATSLPPELRRMIDVYARHRPTSDSSSRVVLTDDWSKVAPDREAIGVPPVDPTARDDQSNHFEVRVAEHALTKDVQDWREVVADAATSAQPPGDGWAPIVSAGPRVLVAVRESPAKQVWVGFTSPSFARRAEYVVFWTGVFDWFAGASLDEFAAEPIAHPAQPKKDVQVPAPRREWTAGFIVAAMVLLLGAVLTWSPPRRGGAGAGVA